MEYQTGTQNGNIKGSSIVSTQKIGEGKYEAENAICLLPGFESNPNDKFSAEIKTINPQYQWQYALSDHLGNLRVLFTDKNNDGLIAQSANDSINEVLSVRNYSPFGLELSGSHKNLDYQNGYKFGGKELNNFTGLTVFGRRNFDAPLGRFTSQDRFSEKYYGMTTMGYAAGNPIKFIDVNGDSLRVKTGENSFAYYFNGNLFNRDGSQYVGQGVKVKKDGSIKLKGRLKTAVNDLNSIANGGNVGSQLISSIVNSNQTATISFTENGNSASRLNVEFNPNISEGGLDNMGNNYRPSYIALAHELAHVSDFINGTLNLRVWFTIANGKNVPRAEIFASNIENLIRRENNINLRAYYTQNEFESARLIDSQGNSLFSIYSIKTPNLINRPNPLTQLKFK
jgi:RHS repeat-associated protein